MLNETLIQTREEEEEEEEETQRRSNAWSQ